MAADDGVFSVAGDNLFTSYHTHTERATTEGARLPRARLPTKSRNNKSESEVTLFMGLLYGDDALRG